MLAETEPAAAGLLAGITYASLAVVTLVYPPSTYAAPEGGSGFLVPSDGGLTISACTWYSTKWPDITDDGRQVVRCVVGRKDTDDALSLDDDQLVDRVQRDLAITMEIVSEPLAARVVRWDRAIPQYRVGHLELVRDIETRLRGVGAIELTGAGYRGSGIPDCIHQAEATARTIGGLGHAQRG
jgi:oxygen-dependent protoporphyrinogen oxidase